MSSIITKSIGIGIILSFIILTVYLISKPAEGFNIKRNYDTRANQDLGLALLSRRNTQTPQVREIPGKKMMKNLPPTSNVKNVRRPEQIGERIKIVREGFEMESKAVASRPNPMNTQPTNSRYENVDSAFDSLHKRPRQSLYQEGYMEGREQIYSRHKELTAATKDQTSVTISSLTANNHMRSN